MFSGTVAFIFSLFTIFVFPSSEVLHNVFFRVCCTLTCPRCTLSPRVQVTLYDGLLGREIHSPGRSGRLGHTRLQQSVG